MAERWDPADQFVLEHIAGGTSVTGDPQQVASGADEHDLLILEASTDRGWLLTSARDAARSPSTP